MNCDLGMPKDKGTPVSSILFALIAGTGSTSPAPHLQPAITLSETPGMVTPILEASNQMRLSQ